MSLVTNLLDWIQNLFDPVVDSGVPLIQITNVVPVERHLLAIAFDNGDLGMVDLERHVKFRGILAPLQDISFFRRVEVKDGMLSWPGNIQMDAMTIHRLAMASPSARPRQVAAPASDRRPRRFPPLRRPRSTKPTATRQREKEH